MPTRSHIGLAFGLATLLLFVDFGTKSAIAQAISVQALVNETTVGTEEAVSYTLEIKGASFSDVETPEPPETEGLVLLQALPSTQRNISFVNGVMEQSVAFQWSYRPVREGTVRILGATVTAKSKTYQTNAIRIKVVPQAQRSQRRSPTRSLFPDPFARSRDRSDDDEVQTQSSVSDRDIFIRAIPSARTAYQNEQVMIEYLLFFRNFIQPRHSRLADSWDAEGFWREELDVEARPMPRSTVENGLRYNSIVLKRVAVFPTRIGTLNIDPLRIETEVFAPRSPGDPLNRFFSLRNPYETIERASRPVTIEARALPDGAPESFQGAVGQFEMKAQISRTEVDVGEPVQVTLRISGTGNLAMLQAPLLNAPGIFEAYEPEVNTVIESGGRRVRGTKTFTYLLVPRSNGTFEVPPIEFAYFDPAGGRYRTLRADPMTISVTGTATTPLATSATAAGLPVDDIARPLTTQADWRRLDRTPLYGSLWTYVALLFPLLLIGLTYAFRRHATRLATDPAFMRNRRAHPLVRKHLKHATTLLQQDHPRAFYEELERAVLGFIGNRLNIAELGLTHAQLDDRLADTGLWPATREELQRLLETCDAARFAPNRPSHTQMEASLDQARGLIVTLDAAFSQQAEEAASA